MKKVLLVALVLSLSFAIGFAQDEAALKVRAKPDVVDQTIVCPNPQPVEPAGRTALTLLETVPVGALTGCLLAAGIDFDGTDWWMTGDFDGYLGLYSLYQINRAGTAYTEYVNTWSTWYPPLDIADTQGTGIVDAAPYDWEGYYNDMYRHVNGIGDNFNPVAICAFASPTGQCYDPVTNTYWVMETWNIAFHNIDAAGTITSIADGSPGTMGMELDQRLPGYEYIWTFQQSTAPEFWVFDLQLGMYNPEVFTASGVDMAGGACIANVTGYTDPVLVGLHQASPDYVNVYELPDLDLPGAFVDIKANGGDAGVVIFDINNVKLTIDVVAANDAGLNSDIFVLVKNDTPKKWCFNLANDRWYKGWCYEYVTGPLADYTDTVLDMPLPVGSYDAWLAIDTVPNGNLDKGSVLVYDHVDFSVVSGPIYDNGDTDGINGISNMPASLFGAYRKLMDDFTIGAANLNALSVYSLSYYGALVGTDMELEFLADAGGTPGGNIATAASVSYSETLTGRTWFGLPEFDQFYTFTPIGFGAGTYWIKYNTVCTDNYYSMVHVWSVGSECWLDYVYDGYYGTGSGLFGAPYDISFRLFAP